MRVSLQIRFLAGIALALATLGAAQAQQANTQPPGAEQGGGEAITPAARALGSRTFSDGEGGLVTVHRNLSGGQTYRDSQGGLVITRPTIMGGEVIRDPQGRLSTAQPNPTGGYTIVDEYGRTTVCRPTIGGQVFCQDPADEPGLVNPRARRDAR